MSVKIHVPTYVTFLTDNNDTTVVEGNTVGECLEELVRLYPQLDQLLFTKGRKATNNFEIYLNMKSINPEGLGKPVEDNDEIAIIATLTGG